MHKFFEQIPEAIYFFTDEKLCPFLLGVRNMLNSIKVSENTGNYETENKHYFLTLLLTDLVILLLLFQVFSSSLIKFSDKDTHKIRSITCSS